MNLYGLVHCDVVRSGTKFLSTEHDIEQSNLNQCTKVNHSRI